MGLCNLANTCCSCLSILPFVPLYRYSQSKTKHQSCRKEAAEPVVLLHPTAAGTSCGVYLSQGHAFNPIPRAPPENFVLLVSLPISGRQLFPCAYKNRKVP